MMNDKPQKHYDEFTPDPDTFGSNGFGLSTSNQTEFGSTERKTYSDELAKNTQTQHDNAQREMRRILVQRGAPIRLLVFGVIAFINASIIIGIVLGLQESSKPYSTEQPQMIPSISDETLHEAMTWGTDENPATLTGAAAQSYQTENWPSGHLKSKEPLVNGQIDGIGLYYFDDGSVYGKIPYRNGQKHGRFSLFHEDGSPDQDLSYKNGQPHGILSWHDTKQTWVYVNGQGIKQIPYISHQDISP